MRMTIEKYQGENASTTEVASPSWEKVYLAVSALEKKEGEAVTLVTKDEDDGAYLKVVGGLDSYCLLYLFSSDSLPPAMRSDDDDPGKLLNAIWIVDKKGAVAAAREYFEKGFLCDSVEWENI